MNEKIEIAEPSEAAKEAAGKTNVELAEILQSVGFGSGYRYSPDIEALFIIEAAKRLCTLDQMLGGNANTIRELRGRLEERTKRNPVTLRDEEEDRKHYRMKIFCEVYISATMHSGFDNDYANKLGDKAVRDFDEAFPETVVTSKSATGGKPFWGGNVAPPPPPPPPPTNIMKEGDTKPRNQ